MHRRAGIGDAASALLRLELWQRKEIELDEDAFDELWDVVTDKLSDLNDERYRLRRK